MRNDVIVLGVFVVDAAYRCPALPRAGQTLLGSGFALGPGGKGSNQAVAAAKAGAEVAFATRIGTDAFAQIGKTAWSEAGVRACLIEDQARPTGSAGIFVEEGTGKNAIVIAPGAAGGFTIADVDRFQPEIARSRIALTQLEQPVEVAQRFLEHASRSGCTTILNPAPAAEISDDLLGLTDFLTPNETEASELTGIEVTDRASAVGAAKALKERGLRRGVVITLGEMGALYWDGESAVDIPPIKMDNVLDTTGAGDAFNGGLAAALACGQTPREALRFATATAAISVTRLGTAASMPVRAEIETLLTD